jgi:Protein of unknown function (DUF2800).
MQKTIPWYRTKTDDRGAEDSVPVDPKDDSPRGRVLPRTNVPRTGKQKDGRNSPGKNKAHRGTDARKSRKGAKVPITVEDKDRPHHPYSPSWLQSGEACPCYRSRDSKHERTIAGTIAHKSTETKEDDSRLSDDDALAVAECIDFYDGRVAELSALSKVIEGSETYLPIDDLKFDDCESTTAGYADRWLYVPALKYAEIIDWKFGMWPVEAASNNLQGMAYAMGIFRKFPDVDSVRVFFKQPHLEYITDHTFTRADLSEIYLRIQTIVARARVARAKAAAGDWSDAKPACPLCNFCDNLGRCEKVLQFACTVGHKFHPLGIPADVTPSLIQDPQNTKLAMELASALKVWCDAFRRQVNDRVMRGDAVMPEGYAMQTMQKREMVDLSKYKAVALNYLSKDEFEACLDTTFSAVEKKIMAKAPRGTKETTVEEFQVAAATAGATKLGEPYSFLKVKSEKPKTSEPVKQ